MLRIALISCLLLSRFAQAVIVQGGDGSQNTTGAGAGDGWSYVGQTGGASGVYLGDYGGSHWVLTAGHVGAGAFTLNGVTYQAQGSAITLTNDAGGNADLVLFRIDGDPGLPALSLSDTPMTSGQTVTMIGNGVNRETSETYWALGWNETSNSFLGYYKGYKWASTGVKRWGQNSVTSVAATEGNTQYFTTTFDRISGDAQATVGDSGGGVFVYRNGSLVLAGSMGLVGTLNGQPVSTSVYGNLTYSADISVYRSQMLEIVNTAPDPASVPEPAILYLLAAGVAIVAVRKFKRRQAGLR